MTGKCVRCKQLRGQLQQQKMSDLPNDRMCIEPPFTYCGVDIFGPFVLKDGRKEVKKYDDLYTCLFSRAIHIEVVHLLSTDSFILSLRRFIGRRGIVRMITVWAMEQILLVHQQNLYMLFKKWITRKLVTF